MKEPGSREKMNNTYETKQGKARNGKVEIAYEVTQPIDARSETLASSSDESHLLTRLYCHILTVTHSTLAETSAVTSSSP